MKATKALIISLIKNDLINYKLVSQLNDMGLYATDYFLQLSDIIFELLGFAEDSSSDKIYELYLEKIKKIKRMDTKKSPAKLDALALEIYILLDVKRSKAHQISKINDKNINANSCILASVA